MHIRKLPEQCMRPWQGTVCNPVISCLSVFPLATGKGSPVFFSIVRVAFGRCSSASYFEGLSEVDQHNLEELFYIAEIVPALLVADKNI